MAKFGGAMSGAPASSPFPMPRPGPSAPMAAPAQAPALGGGGLFPNISAQSRYDMTMSMLQAGMQQAGQSNSPLAAFVAPLAGALIGGKAKSNLDTQKKSAEESMVSAMMPGGMTDDMRQMFDVANNKDAPDFLRSTAQARLKEAMNPKPVGGGHGGGAGGKSSAGLPIYGETIGEDGVLYGHTKTGKALPYVGADGKPFKPKAKGGSVLAADEQNPLFLDSAADQKTDPMGIRQ